MPFDLHPEYPPEGIPRQQLIDRYGDGMIANVKRSIEDSGYVYNVPQDTVPNSLRALELTELAREFGLHKPVHDRLMHAYWSEAADIGDEDTLLGLCEEVGLDRADSVDALAEKRFRERVHAATREAHKLGINAIPAFVLDERLLLVGAYPHETFEQAFEQLAQTPEEPTE